MSTRLRISVQSESIPLPQARLWARSRPHRAWAAGLIFLVPLGTTLVATPAAAQLSGSPREDADDLSRNDARTLRASADPARWLPGAVAASSGSQRAGGFGWGGYDAAAHGPLLGATVEAVLGSRLVIGAGVTYSNAANAQPAMARPSVVARLQVLDQGRDGIDAGVSVGYDRSHFVEEEGEIQVSMASGWRSDRTSLLANVGYGQDGEGDDRVADLRLAGLYRARGDFHVGVNGHLRKLLSSTDPNRATLGTPSLELTAGPAAAWMTGAWAFVVETGVSAIRRETTQSQTGAIVIGGVGALF